jgi:hypothetical protein
MKSLRPIGTIVLVGMYLGGLSACTSVLVNKPVSKSSDGWSLTLNQLKDGPNEYVSLQEGVSVNPGTGENLLWVDLTIRNDNAMEPLFEYDKCMLEGKDVARQPLVIDRKADMLSAADRAETYDPGQQRDRLLIYSFPKDLRPLLLKCEKVSLPIPAAAR